MATGAESQSKGDAVGFARTALGLELLCVDGHGAVDIANWRYGRRFQRRQSVLRWSALALVGLATTLGIGAGIGGTSAQLGLYVAAALGTWLLLVWRQPPRISIVARTQSRSVRIWAWQIPAVRTDVDKHGEAVVVVGRNTLRGSDAAGFLSSFLAQLNGADCVDIPVAQALQRVAAAEKASSRTIRAAQVEQRRTAAAQSAKAVGTRPWEILASKLCHIGLSNAPPIERVALEMAATEDVEQSELAAVANRLEGSVSAEREIATIADDLLLSDKLKADIEALTRHRKHDVRAPRATDKESE